jgi:hypothetical protein
MITTIGYSLGARQCWIANCKGLVRKANSGDRWTVPFGGGIGKLVHFGDQPIDFKLQGLWNAEKPDGAANGEIKFQVKFLFPK